MSDPAVLQPLKTWSHLAGARRRPSEYEVVSVGLHYHTLNPASPWELDPDVFMNRWYRENREGSPLRHDDWDSFRDPDEMVYRAYTVLQDTQESYVTGLLDEHDELGHDAKLSDEWVRVLSTHVTPGRYAAHVLQMISAYGGQMAPSSTITNGFYFQAADEMRLVQHLAYRTRELAEHRPGFGFADKERERWENAPAWQGFRELLEKALVAWDWAECLVALNLVAKPAHDEAVLRQVGNAARASGDTLLAFVNDSHLADTARSRRWTSALVAMALTVDGNREVIDRWVARWTPLADAAIDAYLAEVPGLGTPAADQAKAACRAFRTGLGLSQ